MDLKDFSFDLPESFIAQKPSERRGDDRLMVLRRSDGQMIHSRMDKIADFVPEGALMVFNNSKVRRARVFAQSEATGSRREFLFVKRLACESGKSSWQVMVKNARRHKSGATFIFPDGKRARICEREEFAGSEFRQLDFDFELGESWFEKNGHVPLPPYIRRGDEKMDGERYQTIYAEKIGSVAAPTAGLHFTEEILQSLRSRGVETAFVTLHVGLGTFLPVRTERIEEHKMHVETYSVSAEAALAVERAKAEKRPILACGTTAVRTLESAWDEGSQRLLQGESDTGIFIYPGYKFKLVDHIFTNFHTPQSTLLMLVCAFAGRLQILSAYEEAKACGYKFFSYGDAMLLL